VTFAIRSFRDVDRRHVAAQPMLVPKIKRRLHRCARDVAAKRFSMIVMVT